MEEQTLTLKTLQTHLVKATITSAVSACGVALILMVGFYYNTNSRLNTTEDNVKTINTTLSQHTTDIGDIKQKMAADNANAAAFDKRLGRIEDNQEKTNTLLMEIYKNLKK